MLVRRYGDGMKLVLSQDITERERAEAMRRDFVANVSHEIRTPLTVLAGFVETMAHLPLTEVERQRVLTLMTQQTDRMQTPGRRPADAGAARRQPAARRPTAGCRWPSCCSACEADALALSAGRHTLELRPAAATPRSPAATPNCSARVGNLVNNAVRYTPDGGRIDVQLALCATTAAARSRSATPASASRASTCRG